MTDSHSSDDLTIVDLSKRYGSVPALNRVSLSVKRGEFVSLLGPSGSGKTTLLMAVAGFVTPDEGEILMGGQSITRVAPHKRNIGTMFQSYALFPHLTVFENIGFALRMRGVPKSVAAEKVRTALDLVRLSGLGDRRIQQLSGGQQQRVALARSLVFDPPLMLMDEPMSALDRALKEEMQVELKRIQAQLGVTVVMVTHDQSEALGLSDRIAVMNHGVIEQIGAPNDIYDYPQTQFVSSFIGEANKVAGRVTAMVGDQAALAINGTSVELRSPVSGTAVGDTVEINLRPEYLSLGSVPPSDSKRSTPGTVTQRMFFGGYIRYTVQTSGMTLSIKQFRDANQLPFSPGDAVHVGWPQTATFVQRR